MNFHPILLHFPIAFFTLYSALEILRLPLLTKQNYYFPLKAILLFCGVAAAIPTVLSGMLVAGEFSNHGLVELHEHIQLAAVALFTILAVGYFITLLEKTSKIKRTSFLARIAHIILKTPIVMGLTIAGFGTIMLGSTIGGIIAFGPNLDPFTRLVANFLGIK